MSNMATIQDFLAQKRIAVVGVSREEGHFSQQVFAELDQRGYDVVPVNPYAANVNGKPTYAHVQDIVPPVDAALIMTPPSVTDEVVHDCERAGVRRVWLHRGAGQGAVTPSAVEFCREHGIAVVDGECPFMFLPKTALVHRAHGFVRRISGHYPS